MTITDTTERLYGGLPAMYRDADIDGELLAYVSLWGDQIGEGETLLDRFDYRTADEDPDGGATSDLVDPATADEAWLPWLAQLFGISVTRLSDLAHEWAQILHDEPTWTNVHSDLASWAAVSQHGNTVANALTGATQLRHQIANAALGFWTGSRRAWRALLEPLLTGAKLIVFEANYGGNPWHLNIVTFADSTPLPGSIEAIVAQTPHPAGLTLTYECRSGAAWSDIRGGFATWHDIDTGFDTWTLMAAWTP